MRLGFVGTGWIGRHRMRALAEAGLVTSAVVCDADPAAADAALTDLPNGTAVGSFEELLTRDLDGVVIASPSALHAAQSLAALERGFPVFCQKPIGRTAAEVRAVTDLARERDLLFDADFSYRECEGTRLIRELTRANEIGHVFAIDLKFHNAYGPGKPWFFDPRLSGGGCLVDLGVHLVDLALWTLGFPIVETIRADLFKNGRPLVDHETECEDFARVNFTCAGDVSVNVECSWNVHAGRDAVIEASFFGTGGGFAMKNVDGSFFDFLTERYRGTARETIASPPEDWGGRRVVRWAKRLSESRRFDPEAERFVDVAEILDQTYRLISRR